MLKKLMPGQQEQPKVHGYGQTTVPVNSGKPLPQVQTQKELNSRVQQVQKLHGENEKLKTNVKSLQQNVSTINAADERINKLEAAKRRLQEAKNKNT